MSLFSKIYLDSAGSVTLFALSVCLFVDLSWMKSSIRFSCPLRSRLSVETENRRQKIVMGKTSGVRVKS